VINRFTIATNYFSFWFWFDVLATLPFGSIAGGYKYKAFRVFRVFRLIRFVKLYRLLNISKILGKFINPAYINLIALLTRIFYIAHLLACFWHYIAAKGIGGRPPGYPETWIDNPMFSVQLNTSSDHYVASLYFATVTVLTIGYGDIFPTTPLERIYAMIMMLIGVIAVASLVNRLGCILEAANSGEQNRKSQLEAMYTALEDTNIPVILRSRANAAYAYYLKKKSSYDEEQIILELPPTIRRSLIRR
jgi:hypothetical protein